MSAVCRHVDAVERYRDRHAPLDGAPRPRVIHQQPAHHARRHREEVRAVLPVDASLIDQLEVGLVDQRRRRQRMIPPLTDEIAPRQTAQLVVNGVHQGAAGRLRAVAPREQQARDIRIEGHQSWVRSRILCRDMPGSERSERATGAERGQGPPRATV